MALVNWIPELYSEMLLMDRDKETVFAKLCNRDYTGQISNVGDRVHFTGLADPTIQNYTKEQTLTAEYLDDNTVELVIDQAKYFDVWFDDVDMKQGLKDPTPKVMGKARAKLAETMDAYIASLYSQAGTSVTQTQVTSANIISTIASGMTKLAKNNIPTSEQIFFVASPDITEKIMLADIVHNTDNSATLSGGWIGRTKRFINLSVYQSNNVAMNGTTSYCMMFTKDAIALAEQIPVGSIERMRSESKFADLIRGLHLYGAKVIKPKELVYLALTPAAETGV